MHYRHAGQSMAVQLKSAAEPVTRRATPPLLTCGLRELLSVYLNQCVCMSVSVCVCVCLKLSIDLMSLYQFLPLMSFNLILKLMI